MAKTPIPPWLGLVVILAVLAGVVFVCWNRMATPSGDIAMTKEEYQKRNQMRMQYKEPPYRPGGVLMPEATAKSSLGSSPLETKAR
jgi:hypothetical protein